MRREAGGKGYSEWHRQGHLRVVEAEYPHLWMRKACLGCLMEMSGITKLKNRNTTPTKYSLGFVGIVFIAFRVTDRQLRS